ncbi:MAG TPA: DEAD/DEAH box helicase [Candidatus Dojkabacteria bacterium]
MAHYANNARNNSRGSSNSRQRSGGSSFSPGRTREFQGGGGNRPSYGNRFRSGGGRRPSRPSAQKINRSLYINDLKVPTASDKPAFVGKKYSDFKLSDRLFKNIQDKGYTTATEIQDKAIPLILEGRDVLGISATGSGKTGAFLIPLIQKLMNDGSQKLLVVAPTRELALQIAKEAVSFVRGSRLYVSLIVGGESMFRQISQLKKGTDIIVGTPGRINDLIKRGEIKIGDYNNIVIDEVDRMMDMGFIADIKFIFTKISQKKQALFFSATLNNTVERTVSSLTSSFDLIKLSNNTPSTSVVQSVIDFTHSSEKVDLLEEILKREEVSKAIIFVDTKRFADQIDKILYQKKYRVGVIHSDKRQNVRKRVIDMFKKSKINILVATNVAARGIDIDDITHVINLDEPQTYDEYIHRIGRTGRNGSSGTAYTFVKRG